MWQGIAGAFCYRYGTPLASWLHSFLSLGDAVCVLLLSQMQNIGLCYCRACS